MFRHIFITVFLAVLVSSTGFSKEPGNDLTNSAVLTADGDTTHAEKVVRGLVFENNLGCRVDSRCFLRFLSNDQEIVVTYHYGEWPPCLNEEAANQGEQLKEGDEVEIFGQYGELGNVRGISTCDSKDYYIRKIPK